MTTANEMKGNVISSWYAHLTVITVQLLQLLLSIINRWKLVAKVVWLVNIFVRRVWYITSTVDIIFFLNKCTWHKLYEYFLQHNLDSGFWGSNMNVWRKSAPGSCEKNCVIVVSATSRATAVIFLPRSRPFYPSPPLLLVLHSSAQLFRFSPLFLFSYTIIEATKGNTYSQLNKILTDNKRKYLLPPRSIDHSFTHEVNTFCQHIHFIL